MPDNVATEIGKDAGDLRLWLATEAIRQAELRLASQAANLTALETRATAILGWASAAMVAIAATWSHGAPPRAAIAAGAFLLIAAALCVAALVPRFWCVPGYTFSELSAWDYPHELMYREAVAQGYDVGIQANAGQLRLRGLLLRGAWIALGLAGPAGFTTTLLPPIP